jgi:hypothetical protein
MRRAPALAVVLLSATVLTACGSTTPRADVEERGRRSVQLADLMLGAVDARGRPDRSAGWSGGWGSCVTYTGHQVEMRLSGSFAAHLHGAADKRSVIGVLRAHGWEVAHVDEGAGYLTFDVTGPGVQGSMAVRDDAVELRAGTGCIPVSEEDLTDLEGRPVLHSRRIG